MHVGGHGRQSWKRLGAVPRQHMPVAAPNSVNFVRTCNAGWQAGSASYQTYHGASFGTNVALGSIKYARYE